MLKNQIQQQLQKQSIHSISDIVHFVIQQITQTIHTNPLTQLVKKLNQLQKQFQLYSSHKEGLDNIMIEQVKTITQAMIQQRQCILRENIEEMETNLRSDIDHTLNQHIQTIQTLIQNVQKNQEKNNKKSRQSLTELDIVNLMNTQSFQLNDQTRKIRQSIINLDRKQKENQFEKTRNFLHQISQFNKGNLMSDYSMNKFIDKINQQSKQITQLKNSFLQLNKQISNKINLLETQSIVQSFQNRIYKNIQKDKIQLQKLQYQLKKQLQEQVYKMKKDLQEDTFKIKKEINQEITNDDTKSLKKNLEKINKIEKIEKKLIKYVQQTKHITQSIKLITKEVIDFSNTVQKNQQKLTKYTQFNNTKNEDLQLILEQINQKLSYFEKIDLLQNQINQVNKNTAKSCWITQNKTKNDQIIWQKQLFNSCPDNLKFQKQKSQIFIHYPSLYLVQFSFLQNKQSLITGSIYVNCEQNKKQIKLAGNNHLSTILEVNEKSWISIKLNQSNLGGKGLLKISKY